MLYLCVEGKVPRHSNDDHQITAHSSLVSLQGAHLIVLSIKGREREALDYSHVEVESCSSSRKVEQVVPLLLQLHTTTAASVTTAATTTITANTATTGTSRSSGREAFN